MRSSERKNGANFNNVPVYFENLEERLLLTTLYAGDYFIYRTSEEDAVRIDLIGDPNKYGTPENDCIEILSLWFDINPGDNEVYPNAQYDLVDLVGFYNGQTSGWYQTGDLNNPPVYWDPATGQPILDPTTGQPIPIVPDHTVPNLGPVNLSPEDVAEGWIPNVVNWPVLPGLTHPIMSFDNGDWEWVDYGPTDDPPTRGAETEIFVIQILKCSPDTRLVISELANDDLQEILRRPGDVDVWASDNLPVLEFYQGPNAPEATGSVIVGAGYLTIVQDELIYAASDYQLAGILNPTAYFNAGITISDGTFVPKKGIDGTFSLLNPNVDWVNFDWTNPNDPTITPPITDPAEPLDPPMDMGRIIVGGTVAGEIYAPGSVDIIYMGFLWGNVTVEHNLGDIIMCGGGGGRPYQNSLLTPWYGSSLIHVRGTLDMVLVDAFYTGVGEDTYNLWTAVEVENDPTIAKPDDIIYELEYSDAFTTRYGTNLHDSTWLAGNLPDLSNDIMERAQIINHPTGNFTLSGKLSEDRREPGLRQDWYALPLMAGQTIVVDGHIYDDMSDLWNTDAAVHLYGPADEQNNVPANPLGVSGYDLRWMGSFGYETVEDWAEASAPYIGVGTPKPLIFTAPAAGIYYLVVTDQSSPTQITEYYDLKITNGTHAALGGVEIVGNYAGAPNWQASYNYGTEKADQINIAVKRGGDLGAFVASGDIYHLRLRVLEGGDLVCVQAGGSIPYSPLDPEITSDGYIGRVAAVTGSLSTNIIAGKDGKAYTGFWGTYTPHDAHIQNIYAGGSYGIQVLSATGSIGTIHTGGDLTGNSIIVNSDKGGPVGRIDLIEVGGGLGHINYITGPGGDVGYVRAEAIAYTSIGGGSYPGTTVSPHTPILVDDGSTTILTDDGGGELTITPLPVLDANGNTQRDINGDIIMAQYLYTLLPSDGHQGGILADLTFGGSLLLTVSGNFQIGNLNAALLTVNTVDPTGQVTATTTYQPQVTINGPGVADVYFLDGYDYASGAYTDIISFVNDTPGHLFAGTAGNIQYMELAGDLGQMDVGHTGAWLFSPEQAPIVGDVTAEAQFGWFHSTINGLNVVAANSLAGDLTRLVVDGAIGDLRVEGTLGYVQADADSMNDYSVWDDWDGINGLIWSATRIDYVDVGDGLADDGDSDVARAGIMCSMSIGTVYISGNRYERTPDNLAGINESLKCPMVFGEINGAIIGHDNDTISMRHIGRTVDLAGNIITQITLSPIVITVDAVGEVIGEGSVLTALVFATDLDRFRCFGGSGGITGYVGNVSFTGPGAEIYGADVRALHIREIITSADSNGINHSRFTGTATIQGEEHCIELIVAGGPGMSNSQVYAVFDSIGQIRTAGSKADIKYCEFETALSTIDSISARDLKYNIVRATNGIEKITATRDIVGDYYNVGSIGTMTVGRDFLGNEAYISSTAQMIDINGRFDSTLYMTGSTPSPIGLKTLVVTRDIAGIIGAWGHVGSIISEKGAISANITTYKNDWNADIDMIKAPRGFTGNLNMAGSLGRFYSYASVGENPELYEGVTQVFDIMGDVGYLYVTGKGSDLFADIRIGGNLRVADIDGNFYSNLIVNGDITALYVDGTLGAYMGPLVGNRGSVTALGNLKTLRFNNTQDLIADITVGSSINSLVMRGGDIIGNITSLFGSVNYVYAVYGNILGDITGVSVNNVRATGYANDTSTGNIEGDITATNGTVMNVIVTNGNLEGDVIANNGDIYNVTVIRGDISAGSDIYADKDIRKIYVVYGDMAGHVAAERNITYVLVSRGDLTGMVDGETGIGTVNIVGAVDGGVIRSGANINYVVAYDLDSAVVSAASDINILKVIYDAENSWLMAGYDAAADGEIGGNTNDDNPNTPDNEVHAGNINYLYIGGDMAQTMVCAGMNPNTANLVEASGTSSIKRMYVRGELGAGNAVIADTYIDSTFVNSAAGTSTYIHTGVTNPTDAWSGNDFGPGTVNGPSWVIGDLRLYLSAGTANYNPATGTLLLEQTDARSALVIRYTGDNTYNKTITIICNDDSTLGTLTISGDVQVGDISIDGYVRAIDVSRAMVKSGSQWLLPGGAGTIRTPQLANLDIHAGPITGLYVYGDYTDGSLVADSIRTLYVTGTMAADTTTLMGDASVIYAAISDDDGGMYGDLDVHGTVRALYVYGDLTGDVHVTNGDLYALRAESLAGAVSVDRGRTNSVIITSGDMDGSYRAAGIRVFNVVQGDLTGLISSSDYLTALYVTRGNINGTVAAEGNVKYIVAENIYNSLITAAGDITRVAVRYDMNYSSILAGFDPGDAGYYPQCAELAANLALDYGQQPDSLDQVDRPLAGTISLVTIGNEMRMSTIAAAIDPGQDGYVGTHDDRIRGTGYVGRVIVGYDVDGDNITTRKYGVFAANNMPNVWVYRQPFKRTDNVYVEDLSSPAGPTSAIEVRTTWNTLTVTFKNPLDFSTLTRDTFSLQLSTDPDFDFTTLNNYEVTFYRPGYDPYDHYADATVTYDRANQTLTLKLRNSDWEILNKGVYARLSIDGTNVHDIRGNCLGEDLVRLILFDDMADSFDDEMMPLYLDDGTITFDGDFYTSSDIDVFGFQANAFDFFSAEFFTSNLNNSYSSTGFYEGGIGAGRGQQMALFFRDDQGTTLPDLSDPNYDPELDDTYELVARWENDDIFGNMFQAFELPDTGEYYLVIYTISLPHAYQLSLTLSSTDQKLVNEIGGLPEGEQIAYVSNYVGEHNNLLGANAPKQLVYLDFDGGTTTEYEHYRTYKNLLLHNQTLDTNVDVEAFDIAQIDESLRQYYGGPDYTEKIIYGDTGIGVTGIVENVMKIYSNTAESYVSEVHPNGKQLTIRYVDPTDPVQWNEYLNATEGLWFTTADPAKKGLDPTEDFTTVFIGETQDWDPGIYGISLGLGSGIDVANQSKADNAIVYTGNYGYYLKYAGVPISSDISDRLNQYSRVLANTISHELGHCLGLNHQPTSGYSAWLYADDPDNNPANFDDSNQHDFSAPGSFTGPALMGYPDLEVNLNELSELGTAPLQYSEFQLGWIDTQDLLLKWLA